VNLLEQLDALTIEGGLPRTLRMDNGPEFISRATPKSSVEMDLLFIPPGQPWRRGFIEYLSGRLPDECFNVSHFYFLGHTKGIWKMDYNTIRPRSSLGYLPKAVG